MIWYIPNTKQFLVKIDKWSLKSMMDKDLSSSNFLTYLLRSFLISQISKSYISLFFSLYSV